MSGGIASGMTDGTDRRHRHTADRKWNGIPGHAKKTLYAMPCGIRPYVPKHRMPSAWHLMPSHRDGAKTRKPPGAQAPGGSTI